MYCSFIFQDKEEDMQFPIFARNIRYLDVASDAILHYDRPSLGKINPADCVDMPCDAKKKAIIYDLVSEIPFVKNFNKSTGNE